MGLAPVDHGDEVTIASPARGGILDASARTAGRSAGADRVIARLTGEPLELGGVGAHAAPRLQDVLGGPRYLLPEWVQAEGYRVYFTLVDIAPTEESGRRQRRRPSRISEQELIDATPLPDNT